MTFDEDRGRIRSGHSADTFGRVLNAAMNALRALGPTNLARRSANTSSVSTVSSPDAAS